MVAKRIPFDRSKLNGAPDECGSAMEYRKVQVG